MYKPGASFGLRCDEWDDASLADRRHQPHLCQVRLHFAARLTVICTQLVV